MRLLNGKYWEIDLYVLPRGSWGLGFSREQHYRRTVYINIIKIGITITQYMRPTDE